MRRVLLALRQRDLPFMLMCVVAIHIGLGIALINDARVPQLSVLLGLHIYGELLGHLAFGILLVTCGLIALAGLVCERCFTRRQVVMLLAPQYCLIFSAFGIVFYILLQGEFHGRPFPFWVGFAGLWPGMCIAIFHTWAVLNRYIWGRADG